MLTLTENATTIVRTITDQSAAQTVTPNGTEPTADAAGLRISSEAGPAGEGFTISAAAGPEPEDQVVEQDGATVYLDAPSAAVLDEQVLDAGVDESGNVQFALAAQPG